MGAFNFRFQIVRSPWPIYKSDLERGPLILYEKGLCSAFFRRAHCPTLIRLTDNPFSSSSSSLLNIGKMFQGRSALGIVGTRKRARTRFGIPPNALLFLVMFLVRQGEISVVRRRLKSHNSWLARDNRTILNLKSDPEQLPSPFLGPPEIIFIPFTPSEFWQ